MKTWMESAACRGQDPTLFFGPEGERQPERELRERGAKKVCKRCPVAAECLDAAVEHNEQVGVWGGLGEDERVSERRRRMRRANAA
jgi:WhiB family redox-sensing transcriptional regulator